MKMSLSAFRFAARPSRMAGGLYADGFFVSFSGDMIENFPSAGAGAGTATATAVSRCKDPSSAVVCSFQAAIFL